MKRLFLVLFALLLAFPAGAQLPPSQGLVVGSTPIQKGTLGDCLTVGAGGKLDQAVCGAGSVTTWSGGTTGLLPSSATSGAITVTGVLIGANGGTGVANTGKTITIGGNLTTSGAFASTFTMTNTTAVTFPTSGTLATVGGNLGVFTGTSLALGGATIGTNGLAVTGTALFNGNISGASGVAISLTGGGSLTQNGANVQANGVRFNDGSANKGYLISQGTDGLFQWLTEGGGNVGVTINIATADTLKCRNKANSADCTITFLTQSAADNSNKGATTAYVDRAAVGVAGGCVNWTGGGTTINRVIGNIASITRNGAGDYTVNGTYPANAVWQYGMYSNSPQILFGGTSAPSTSIVRLLSYTVGLVGADALTYWACNF